MTSLDAWTLDHIEQHIDEGLPLVPPFNIEVLEASPVRFAQADVAAYAPFLASRPPDIHLRHPHDGRSQRPPGFPGDRERHVVRIVEGRYFAVTAQSWLCTRPSSSPRCTSVACEPSWNCAASVLPDSAVVEDFPPEIAIATASK
jgi:hypothetical protein